MVRIKCFEPKYDNPNLIPIKKEDCSRREQDLWDHFDMLDLYITLVYESEDNDEFQFLYYEYIMDEYENDNLGEHENDYLIEYENDKAVFHNESIPSLVDVYSESSDEIEWQNKEYSEFFCDYNDLISEYEGE